VLEDGCVTHPESGSPQGGVISPILANAYLHEVLDEWFERTVKPRLKGRASLIRYADDAVLVFGSEDDARRVLDVLPKRFAKYGLTLHPGKTRLVRFGRPRLDTSREGRPGTFDFLGFTHHWGRTLRGGWAVKRRTAKDRFNRSVKSMVSWCREHRHLPIREQWLALTSKLRGHYAYYAVIGNMARVNSLLYHVRRAWQKWLSRRSDKARIAWERFGELERRFPLPPARLRGVRLVT